MRLNSLAAWRLAAHRLLLAAITAMLVAGRFSGAPLESS
jgi:hypothetical protein